jgi:signal transduction histidine kinase
MTNLLEDLQASNRRLERTSAQLKAANEELNDFAYVVSHDLKAPLRGIIQLSNWLSDDYADALDAEGQEMLGLMVGRARRMHDLIEGILQYSRVGRIHEREKEIDLNALVRDVLDLLAPSEDITVEIPSNMPTLRGAETRFRQVFQNLLSNAFKFLDKPQGQVTIICEEQDGAWLFGVADNGPGIAEKYYDKVFQMFQTLAPRDEYESTGVGLALVKKIVETWGGRIWLDSTVGEGSTFYFTFPKTADALSD